LPKTLLQSVSTLAKNVSKHAKLIATREETPGEAWVEITRDVRKLKKTLARPTLTQWEKEAAELVSRGRHAYNAKDYEKAEAFFRQALVADKNHCLAQTYLGHTLYKLGRFVEAKHAWERALEVAPNLEAGEKARKKLLMLEQKKTSTMHDIEDRLRRER
jgi:tetratricopeptide (TPR) repeat protein